MLSKQLYWIGQKLYVTVIANRSTKELRLRAVRSKAESNREPDVTLAMEERFRSVGIGELEKVYAYLYPNPEDLVNQNEISPGDNKLFNYLSLLKSYTPMYGVRIFWRLRCGLDKLIHNKGEIKKSGFTGQI